MANLLMMRRHLKSGSFRDELDVHAVPVQVVIQDENHCFTGEWFENFAAAKAKYADLDIYTAGPRFGWSMKGVTPDGRVGLRFENHAAYRTLSV